MKITTFASWKSMDDFLQNKPADQIESFEHRGEIAKLDRAAVSQARNAADTAGGIAANDNSNAEDEHAQLQPFFNQEMHAEHGFTPEQTNEMLTEAEAGSGGATSGLEGQAQLQQARTRNASGFTKSLDEAARDRQKASAATSEGVAAADVAGAKALNQEGAEGEAKLYGTDTSAEDAAMGIQNEEQNTALAAQKVGWMQNLSSAINDVGGIEGDLTGAAAVKKAF